jgi:transcription elongation GreA/GreB family factor
MSLAIYATEDNWQGFDDAWNELMTSEGPVEELVSALEIVASKRRLSRCLPLLREHAEMLEQKSRHAEAALLLGAALRGGGPVGELALPLLAHADKAWSSEPWWPAYTDLSGFKSDAMDLRRAWTAFEELRAYQVGAVVFHRAGWGIGEVTEVSLPTLDVAVQFQSGRKDRFPLSTAITIFERLPVSDLRVQALRDPDGLKRRLQKEPIEILRSVLLRYNGKASSVTIKNALQQIGVDGSAWTNWWRKARLQAENSEWFKVSGNATRAEVELLRRAIDPVEGLQRQLRHAVTLGDALSRVRDLLSGNKLGPAVQEAALAVLEELARDPKQDLDSRLAAWMLLREHRKSTPAELAQLLRDVAAKASPSDPSVPPPLWALLQKIPGVREQERSAELLREAYGDERWVDEAVRHLQHASPGMLKPLIDALLQHGREEELAAHYRSLLARPTRAPFALITLARLAEDGKIRGEYASGAQRAQALLELAVELEQTRKGDNVITRAHQRLVDLLTKPFSPGEPPLLRKLLVDASNAEMHNLRVMLQRGIDDNLEDLVTDIALEKGPDTFKSDAGAFWKEDRIWTTRAGLARRDAELHELTDRKIPANSEAIARAASYGDISENAEWENAIAEQRQLTDAASQIERELRLAALLENATIPENTVCPGTAVRYRELKSGEEHEIEILGPWDTDRPRAVSYRAPLAWGMLGLNPGGLAHIELPSGAMEIQVLSVAPASL